MKKLAILSALALALGFTACDDNDVIEIPVNPESAIFNIDNLTVSPASETASTLDLAAYKDNGTAIPMETITISDFPEDYNLSFVMQISKDDTFGAFTEVATTVTNDTVFVEADALQNAYYNNISKSPKEKSIYARYAAYAVKGATNVRLGDPEYFFGPVELKVLPIPGDFVIEEAYYLVGTACDWSVAEAIKFNHAEGVSQYDDPVFSLDVTITDEQVAGGWWWKIVPQSVYATGNWGEGVNSQFGPAENGDESLSGMLTGNDPGAGCIKQAGPFIITINMEEMSYNFQAGVKNLYTPGPANGWSPATSNMLYTYDYMNYQGYAHIQNEFKFTGQPDWSPIDFGVGEKEGTLAPKGGNISVPGDALYWVNANIVELTYSLTPITTIGVIGDATPNGWDASTALTPSADFLVWEGDITFKGGEFKFRANDDWGVNLGGSVDYLAQNGANLASPGEGVYHVKLDLTKLPYSCTLTGK